MEIQAKLERRFAFKIDVLQQKIPVPFITEHSWEIACCLGRELEPHSRLRLVIDYLPKITGPIFRQRIGSHNM